MEFAEDLKICRKDINSLFNIDMCNIELIIHMWLRSVRSHGVYPRLNDNGTSARFLYYHNVCGTNEALNNTLMLYHLKNNDYQSRWSDRDWMKFPATDNEATVELHYLKKELMHAAQSLQVSEDLQSFLYTTIKIRNLYRTYKKCVTMFERKCWLDIKLRDLFITRLQQSFTSFKAMTASLSGRLYSTIDIMCFYMIPIQNYNVTLFSEARLKQMREKCAVLSLVYRNSEDLNIMERELPKFCFWEISWANASAMNFGKRLSGMSLNIGDCSINGIPHFEIPGSGRVVSVVDMLCLWSTLAARTGHRRSYICMLRLIRETRMRIVQDGPSESRSLETDVAMLTYIEGCCLASLNLLDRALEIFRQVGKSNNITDNFLVPFAKLEEGLCYKKMGDFQKAQIFVNKLWDRYYTALSPEFRFACNSCAVIIMK